MKEQAIVTDLVGLRVEWLTRSCGKDTGTIRAIYLSPGGSPKMLVSDSSGRLSEVYYDVVRIVDDKGCPHNQEQA